MAKAHPDHPDALAALATSHANIGLVLMRRGETASARQSLRQARLVVVRLKDQGADAASILGLYEAALIKLDTAAMSIEGKDTGAALDALQQAREVLAQIKKLFPGDDAFVASGRKPARSFVLGLFSLPFMGRESLKEAAIARARKFR